MRRVLLGLVSSLCVLASFAFFGSPAKAGENLGDPGPVWYSSDCCYVRVVRHITAVGATCRRAEHHRDGLHVLGPTAIIEATTTASCAMRMGYDGWRVYRGYRSYRYANLLPPPDCRLVRLADLDGTWVWARRAGCL